MVWRSWDDGDWGGLVWVKWWSAWGEVSRIAATGPFKIGENFRNGNQAVSFYAAWLDFPTEPRQPRSEANEKGSRLTAIRRSGQPGFRSRFEGANLGCFSCPKEPHAFCPRDKGGGVA